MNDLIRINNDRIEGYTKAEKESEKENTDLIKIFQKMVSQSMGYVNELRSLVMKYGGTVATGSTTMGKIYRTWMDIQIAFSANDRKNILNACEFGEDAAQKAYKLALEQTDLTEEARSLIASQKSELKNAHDIIKAYRDRQKVAV